MSICESICACMPWYESGYKELIIVGGNQLILKGIYQSPYWRLYSNEKRGKKETEKKWI